MAKKGKKQSGSSDIFESSEALAEKLSRGEQFLEKNKRPVFIIGGILIAVVVGVFLFRYYKESQNRSAQSEMFQAQYYFEKDSLDKALNGDGNNYGFLDIIDEYPMSEAANLANFYAGTIYLKQGSYDEAIKHLEKFSSDDILVQARAYCLIGDALMEQGLYNNAAEKYKQAANYEPNEQMSPLYLKKAAIAYEKMQDYEMAAKMYSTIVDKYKDSQQYQYALKQKARLEAMLKKG